MNSGGKLTYQTAKKRAKGPRCPVTGKRIQGVWDCYYYMFHLLNLWSLLPLMHLL